MTDPKSRRKHEQRGRRAEWIAALWLRLKGWSIIEARARTGAGEIDLIARKGQVLAFVEVKARPDRERGLEAVTPRQRARLIRAGAVWRSIHSRYATLQPRYDLIVIVPKRWPVHIPGAFQAEGRSSLELI